MVIAPRQDSPDICDIDTYKKFHIHLFNMLNSHVTAIWTGHAQNGLGQQALPNTFLQRGGSR